MIRSPARHAVGSAPIPSTIRIQIRDHEYAPWTEVEVMADYRRDNLGFVHFQPKDGARLLSVDRSNVRRQNPDWRPRSFHRRWTRLPR